MKTVIEFGGFATSAQFDWHVRKESIISCFFTPVGMQKKHHAGRQWRSPAPLNVAFCWQRSRNVIRLTTVLLLSHSEQKRQKKKTTLAE